MISRFFIDRPIFAAVLSIFITLTGGIALLSLPLAQYPPVTPPAVTVSIFYPGASAQVVADTVAAPIEQQVNGVEGMLYMASQMGNDGSYTLTVTFDIGTDLNTALVMVQNRVQQAMPLLPTSVQNQGITIRKKTPDILNIINFYSPDGRYDDVYLSNYATIHVLDELLRIEGVSQINYQGVGNYSIRAWLDPQKLASLNMTVLDVANAIRNQNLDAPAGALGQPPSSRAQPFELPIDALGRLTTTEQFGDLIVKADLGQPPPTAGAAPAPSPGTNGLPAGGSTGPLDTGGTTLGPMAGMTIGNTTLSTSAYGNATGGTTATGMAFETGMTTGMTGSAMAGTTGVGMTSGGGTTAGGAQSVGGAMTGGGATATAIGGGPTGLGGGPSVPGATPGVAGKNGVLSATAMGRGQARPAVGIVRLRDVGRVELGAQNYSLACLFDGRPSVGLAIFQLPGTNALDVADRVRAKMEELKADFPEGVDYQIAYDTTPFIRESVADVVHTLLEAVALVAVVVLVFLQNWRSALIPLAAVPVAVVGTFAVMAALGFSLNNVSLFGLVLAIGIVVDDAIVVVENVERWLEHGLPPREAARRAMDEVTGPVVAVALVLCAVFVPCAFISGITGQFFRQFAVTIAASTVISAFNSLTLSPALAAILLKPHGARRDPLAWLLDKALGWFFRLFNWAFGKGTAGYGWVVGRLLRVNLLVLLVYGGLLVLTWWAFRAAPAGFVPQQDQGRIICTIQLPDSASLERTKEAVAQIESIARRTKGVAHTIAISGTSFVLQANSPTFATMFVVLEPFAKRTSPEMSSPAIIARLRAAWAREIKDAQVIAFGAPAIPGLSVAGGFKYMVEDRGGLGPAALQRQTDALVAKLKANPALAGASTQFRSNTPQIFADIDRAKVASLGVSLLDVNQTMGTNLGSLYVTSFNEFGRYWQVTVQADARYRNRVEDINLLQVRNQSGQMVLLGTLVKPREVGGPVYVTRYNLATAATVTGSLAPGASTGTAIQEIDRLSHESLPISMQGEWTEIMFMQIRAGNTAMYVFALAVVCVFLALAALYESWALPLAVILVVPLCLLCSVAGVLFTHKSVDIFVQIGLVVLVGLACKNAILIVEFAKQTQQEGKPRFEATVEASRLRLRPILMTSFAFILGVVPLVVATGAGAEMRRSLGTAVFSGMLGVTLFGIFLTPAFFYVLQGLGETRLFASGAIRRVGSPLAGGLSGLAAGFLLARVTHLSPLWEAVIGGTAAVLGGLLVLALARVVRRRAPQAPPEEPTGGQPT
ncbi:MAG TPA: efflux RND transporter permease subunit [Candidatus Dormibacteraeota bacterium]|nr:efflux RND transporter permease subunit [Candidatus Dormibacteraeota bacterium]